MSGPDGVIHIGDVRVDCNDLCHAGARYKKLSFLVPTEELKRPFRKVNLTDILKSDVLAFLSLHNAEWVGPPGVEQPSEMDEYSLGALREYDFEDGATYVIYQAEPSLNAQVCVFTSSSSVFSSNAFAIW